MNTHREGPEDALEAQHGQKGKEKIECYFFSLKQSGLVIIQFSADTKYKRSWCLFQRSASWKTGSKHPNSSAGPTLGSPIPLQGRSGQFIH